MQYLEIALPIPTHKNFFYFTEEPIEVGARVKVKFGSVKKTAYVISIFDSKPQVNYKIQPIIEILDNESLIDDKLMQLASDMSAYYLCSMGEALSVILPVALKSYKKARKVQPDENKHNTGYLLLPEQQKVMEPVMQDVDRSRHGKYLLFGVTDSGKTEIYISLISELMQKKRQTIILVPDIVITSQLESVLKQRFGDKRIAVWHSRMTSPQKMAYLKKLRSGEINVLLGTRSAVFVPVKDLGAIIIDEEHDSSYKNTTLPYYDARWVAERRCELSDSVLLRGSATPSIEVLYAAKNKKYKLLELKGRVHHSSPPKMLLVDMRSEIAENNKGTMFSRILLAELKEVFNKKKQAILFLNRRGFAPSVVCKKCGEFVKCPKCDIAMVYHEKYKKILCHWCEYKAVLNYPCKVCGSMNYKKTGIGTQRVETAVKKMFPEVRIARLDFDSTLKKGSAETIFKSFLNSKYDLLIGTQIVTRGWDFPHVDLVGVINSDIGLMIPDFRAAERNYALLKQLEGRAGRGKNRGKIVIQTFNTEHYGVKLLFEEDYMKYYKAELAIRKESGFPPYSSLINIVSEHKVERRAYNNIAFCRDFINNNMKNITLLGPVPAPIARLRGKYRWQLLIRHNNDEKLWLLLRELLVDKKYYSKLKIDVDPQDML